MCASVTYAVVTLDFTVEVVSASASGHNDVSTSISGTTVEFVIGNFADFSTATFTVELDTCGEDEGAELLTSAGYYDSVYTDNNAASLARLTITSSAPSCEGKATGTEVEYSLG